MSKEKQNWERTRLTLIGRLKDLQDQESWAEFVDLYWRRLYSVAVSKGLTDSEAKDAAQETLIGLSKDIDKYNASLGRFTPWLLGRLKWRIEDQLRKRKHQYQSQSDCSDTRSRTDTIGRIPDQRSPTLEELSEAEWKQYLFKLALEKIKHEVSPAHFQIFDLYALKKLPTEEVASLAGVTPNTVFVVKSRILELLEEEIKRLKELSP